MDKIAEALLVELTIEVLSGWVIVRFSGEMIPPLTCAMVGFGVDMLIEIDCGVKNVHTVLDIEPYEPLNMNFFVASERTQAAPQSS